MIARRLTPLLALLVIGAAACDDEDPVGPEPILNFAASLSGSNERPNPVNPAGTGTATFTVNDAETEISYSISVQNMTSAITAAHIHLGGPEVAGNIIVALANPVNGGTVTGTITRQNTLQLGLSFESLLALMRTGDTYVNVHTQTNPTGETRGQILPVQ